MSTSRPTETDILTNLMGRQVALSTLESESLEAADNLTTAIVRGNDELFRWRVGAEVNPGDIVAIYVPFKTMNMPVNERGNVSRIYSVARRCRGAGNWQYVFLYRRVELHRRLNLDDLDFLLLRRKKQYIPTDAERRKAIGRSIRTLHDGNALLSPVEKRCFWKRCFDKNPHLEADIADRLLEPTVCPVAPRPHVAISFAGEDWEHARRLRLWCEAKSWNTFLAAPVEDVADQDRLRKQLRILLRRVYRNAKFGIVIVPKYSKSSGTVECWSSWMQLELKVLMERPKKLIFIRVDPERMKDEELRREVRRITGRELSPSTPVLNGNQKRPVEFFVVDRLRRSLPANRLLIVMNPVESAISGGENGSQT